jgi:hypothetical protein
MNGEVLHMEQTMNIAKSARSGALSRNPEAREIHELAYFKHRTGASENAIRQAIEEFGHDRAIVERELMRRGATLTRVMNLIGVKPLITAIGA